jgi:hypothetical protein
MEAFMDGSLPFIILPSNAVRNLLGRDVPKAALIALRAVLANRKSLEVAHQQVRYGKHRIACSSRVSRAGDLVVELDVGDPQLDNIVVLEADLRRAETAARERNDRRSHPRDGRR